ncbi:MAG: NYN domain-containing protein [Proteobacteria bacterium]|nr:NYN domain-containing protein [Pseudomonadota bacterium]
MVSETRSDRLAVLIDADNVSARIAEGLFEEIAKIGEASVRRIYGDFSGTGHKSWADILSRHAIIPHQNFAYTKGKNASDIALVIDAMDLLHSGRFDGFCLVSSDSDFTRLASRIREQGIDVYGFGQQKTPESFRQACLRFIFTENLLPEAPAPDRDPTPGSKPLQPPSAAIPVLRKAIALLDDDDGWVGLSAVGQQLGKLAPDFDPRTYGHAKLSDLVKKTGVFEVELPKGKGMRIRPKISPNKKSAAKK